jgi:outer membrane immunogenic protein
MKKLVLALSAVAAFAAPALAADLPARTYSKAPAVVAAPAPTWTGCYVGGGGGYGMWNQENTSFVDFAPPRTQISDTSTTSGRGYFGTVQGGCDYQFSQFVVGAFGDYDFSSLKGNLIPPGASESIGSEKMSSAWSVGGRAGWLVTPSLLTYFSAGYTQATFDRVGFTNNFAPFGVPNNLFIDKNTYHGYFLGAGDEYALSFVPGLFWKTEYRLAQFGTKTNPLRDASIGGFAFDSIDSKKWVQTIRSELTYHFNWGGPLVAKY